MEAEALRLLIRSKLNDNDLPYDDIPRISGGLGKGERCGACDTSITKTQLLVEDIASPLTEQKPMPFHVKCFYVWDVERRAPKPYPRLPSRAVVTVAGG